MVVDKNYYQCDDATLLEGAVARDVADEESYRSPHLKQYELVVIRTVGHIPYLLVTKTLLVKCENWFQTHARLQTNNFIHIMYRYFVFRSVELCHSFNFAEHDGVAVLEPVQDAADCGDDSFGGDARQPDGDWHLAVDIVDDELLTEVGEDLGK